MKYQVWDLGRLERGAVVVKLTGNAANVRLMDSSNYSSYKSGRRHSYFGGLATKSPVRLAVSVQWTLVCHGGLRRAQRLGARECLG